MTVNTAHPLERLPAWRFAETRDLLESQLWAYWLHNRFYCVVSHETEGWLISIEAKPYIWRMFPWPKRANESDYELDVLEALRHLSGEDCPYREFWVQSRRYFQALPRSHKAARA